MTKTLMDIKRITHDQIPGGENPANTQNKDLKPDIANTLQEFNAAVGPYSAREPKDRMDALVYRFRELGNLSPGVQNILNIMENYQKPQHSLMRMGRITLGPDGDKSYAQTQMNFDSDQISGMQDLVNKLKGVCTAPDEKRVLGVFQTALDKMHEQIVKSGEFYTSRAR